MIMRKQFYLLFILLSIFHLANAQLKLCVYENNGYVKQFVASNVDSLSFTPPSDNPINPNSDEVVEFVDLGLSVRWATCNIGATAPEEYGEYFAWGEVQTKKYYDFDNYKWTMSMPGTITKYCTMESYGYVDDKTQLEPADDAARVNLADRWRMPTKYEFYELIYNCSLNWTEKNGVPGYECVSRFNGKSIFIPAAGYNAHNPISVNEYGYYWTSLLDQTNNDRAMQFAFNKESVKIIGGTRYYGQPIRPVLP